MATATQKRGKDLRVWDVSTWGMNTCIVRGSGDCWQMTRHWTERLGRLCMRSSEAVCVQYAMLRQAHGVGQVHPVLTAAGTRHGRRGRRRGGGSGATARWQDAGGGGRECRCASGALGENKHEVGGAGRTRVARREAGLVCIATPLLHHVPPKREPFDARPVTHHRCPTESLAIGPSLKIR